MNNKITSVRYFIVSLLVAGCGTASHNGHDLVPVSGSILVEGKALEGLVVEFKPSFKWPDEKMPFPRGTTDAEGKFNIGTLNSHDGAMPGDYLVSVKTVSSDGLGKLSAPIAPEYSDPEKSGLKVTVSKNSAEIPVLKLKSNMIEQKIQKNLPKK
ncbi:MAG: hypothetical protein ACKO5E_14140 [bacterium]